MLVTFIFRSLNNHVRTFITFFQIVHDLFTCRLMILCTFIVFVFLLLIIILSNVKLRSRNILFCCYRR